MLNEQELEEVRQEELVALRARQAEDARKKAMREAAKARRVAKRKLVEPPLELVGRVERQTLETIRSRGGCWWAYENQDLGSGDAGRLVFLRCGEGCTHATPPPRAPDGSYGLGWRYLLVGQLDLETGEVV